RHARHEPAKRPGRAPLRPSRRTRDRPRALLRSAGEATRRPDGLRRHGHRSRRRILAARLRGSVAGPPGSARTVNRASPPSRGRRPRAAVRAGPGLAPRAEPESEENAMPTMEELLREAADKVASDLHLSSGEPPVLRLHGDLVRTAHAKLAPADVSALVHSIMSEGQRARFDAEHEVDFACELPGKGRFRVNVFLHSRGPGAVLRAIPSAIPSLESLQMPAVLKELCTRERGLVLVTGPTGSGKSTTLAAMLDLVNQTWDAHILTVEDPIEFVHPPKRC